MTQDSENSALIKPVISLVQELLKYCEVKVFTARAANGERQIEIIQDWTERHIGKRLEVTDKKDFNCIWIIDDRAINPPNLMFTSISIPISEHLT